MSVGPVFGVEEVVFSARPVEPATRARSSSFPASRRRRRFMRIRYAMPRMERMRKTPPKTVEMAMMHVLSHIVAESLEFDARPVGVGVGVAVKKLRDMVIGGAEADVEDVEVAGIDDEGRVASVEAAEEGKTVVEAEFINVAVTEGADATGAAAVEEGSGMMGPTMEFAKLLMRLTRVSMPSGDGAGAGAIVRVFLLFVCSLSY